jgi:hypothetical protein
MKQVAGESTARKAVVAGVCCHDTKGHGMRLSARSLAINGQSS